VLDLPGRTLQEDWGRRGWIAKDPQHDNSFSLTERGKTLIRADPGRKTDKPANPTNPSKPRQTG
jgi:hypothetical protein